MSYIIYDTDKKTTRKSLAAYETKPDRQELIDYLRENYDDGVFYAESISRNGTVKSEQVIVPPKTPEKEPRRMENQQSFAGNGPNLTHITDYGPELRKIQLEIDTLRREIQQASLSIPQELVNISNKLTSLTAAIDSVKEDVDETGAIIDAWSEKVDKYGPTIMAKFGFGG